MSGPILRVLVADDQAAVRGAFRIIIDAQPDMRVVAEAADGASAIEAARRLRPDVVLADIRMPGADGLEVTRSLAGPDVEQPLKVVVVTTFDLDDYVHAALRGGAAGFLLKRSGPTLLCEAIRAAARGDVLISPQLTVRLLRHVSAPVTPVESTGEDLTPREREVAGFVAHALTNDEIAERLCLASGTVKNHLANVQRKLGVPNRVGVAAWAWRSGHAR